MTLLDRFIQKWRIHTTKRFLTQGDKVLDIGCSNGILFRSIRGIHGIGVDPVLNKCAHIDKVELIEGFYPEAISIDEKFDKICMLAVLEHIPIEKQFEVAKCCFHQLRPNGYLIITVPSPTVDRVLDILTFLHLVEGIEINQHYGFKPSLVCPLFESVGFVLNNYEKFEIGLNNLFVFKKPIIAQ